MIIKPAKPASGLAIRNAFQYAALGILGDQRYALSHERRRGEMRFDFSNGSESPAVSHAEGDSVRISNTRGKTVRLSLVPVRDEHLYEEFEIVAADILRDFEYDRLSDFEDELAYLTSLMNKRLAMWGVESVGETH